MYIKSSVVWLELICLAFTLKSAGAKMKTILSNIECRTYGQIMQNTSCYINQTSQNGLSAEFVLAKDLNVLNGHFMLSTQRGSLITDYISMDLDYCELFASQHYNYLIRSISNDVRKASNFPVNCPFKKNKRYYVKEYTVDGGHLPSYLPDLDFITDMKFNYNKKILLHIILRGRIFRN